MPIEDEAFVRLLFRELLGREPGTGDVDTWVAALRGGQRSPDQVFREVAGSAEATRAIPNAPAFAGIFGGATRAPWTEDPSLVTAAGEPTLIDVGAMALGFENDVWRPLVEGGWQVIGFEPQEQERSARRQQDPWMELHGHFVGDGAPATFYANETPSTSSLFPPSPSLDRFVGMAEGHRVASTHPVETVRLDDVPGTAGAVFLKLDVQGAELAVLRGAERVLADALVVQVEVQFNPLYEGVPLFGDVDRHLRGRGFELLDVLHQHRYHHDDGRDAHPWAARHLMWGDAVYVATPERLAEAPAARVVAAAWVGHELYSAYDWTSQVLRDLDLRDGSTFSDRHARLLEGQPSPPARAGSGAAGRSVTVPQARSERWVATPVDVAHLVSSLDAEERRLRAAARNDPAHLHHHESSRWSQGGEDGIIAEIFRRIGTTNRAFVELGASDGGENCTRALLEDGWSGVWVEADPDAVAAARVVVGDRPVEVVRAFIDADNVCDLLASAGAAVEPDVLVVDLDGNDLWVWQAVAAAHRPRVLVLEYNSVVGPWLEWVMPYDADHRWDGSSRFGSSLAAQAAACDEQGYRLVACDRSGVNAFYVRHDLSGHFTEREVRDHFVGPRYALPFGHPATVTPPLHHSAVAGEGDLELSVRLPVRRTLEPGERLYFEAALRNTTDGAIGESSHRPVRLSAWWTVDGVALVDEPARLLQPWRADAGAVAALVGFVVAPDLDGHYELEIGLVQEGVAWLGGPSRVRGGSWSVAAPPGGRRSPR